MIWCRWRVWYSECFWLTHLEGGRSWSGAVPHVQPPWFCYLVESTCKAQSLRFWPYVLSCCPSIRLGPACSGFFAVNCSPWQLNRPLPLQPLQWCSWQVKPFKIEFQNFKNFTQNCEILLFVIYLLFSGHREHSFLFLLCNQDESCLKVCKDALPMFAYLTCCGFGWIIEQMSSNTMLINIYDICIYIVVRNAVPIRNLLPLVQVRWRIVYFWACYAGLAHIAFLSMRD